MNKSVCLLSLNKSAAEDTINAEKLLINALNGYYGTSGAERFNSAKVLLSVLPERLKKNSTVVIAAELPLFYTCKDVLIRALSLKTESYGEVTASLPVSYMPKTEQEYKLVTNFPCGSDLFLTSNGLFTGFGVTSGEQNILLVPLEANRINFMFSYDLGDFLKKVSSGVQPVAPAEEVFEDDDDDLTFETETLPEENPADSAPAGYDAPDAADVPFTNPAPADEAVEDISEKPEEPAEPANTALSDAANRTVGKLIANVKRCAVSMSGPYDSLKDLFAATPNAATAVVFDEVPCAKWTGGEFNDYLADVAGTTRTRCKTDYAVALSGLYQDPDANGVFMFFAIADRDGARIVKVSGEEASVVAYDCATKLIDAVGDACDGPFAVAPKPPESPEVVKSKAPMIIAIIFIILALLGSAAIGYFKRDNIIIPEEVEEETETTTEAPIIIEITPEMTEPDTEPYEEAAVEDEEHVEGEEYVEEYAEEDYVEEDAQ